MLQYTLPDEATGNNSGTPRYRGRETVVVQGGYGVVVAIPVQGFSDPVAVAVQSSLSAENISGYC